MPDALGRYHALLDTGAVDLSQPLPPCIWRNPLKVGSSRFVDWLQSEAIAAVPLAWYPEAFRCPGWQKPGATLAFAAGWYYVQEEIAMTAVQALDPQPGEVVLDLCAAPGGKTAQMALRVGQEGQVVANEKNLTRLASLTTTIARLGLWNVITTHADGREIALPNHAYDRVLVDAPCSGEGTFRKQSGRDRASAKSWNAAFSQRLARVQQALLDRALQLVKPGGVVVYSTCTFAPEENEAVIDAVLGDRGSLEAIALGDLQSQPGLGRWQGQAYRADLHHARRFFPHHNDTGGFFLARIRRTTAHLTPTVSPTVASPVQPIAPDAAIAWLGDRFGLAPMALANFQLWTKGKDKLWATTRTCQPTVPLVPQSLGLILLRIGQADYKPTTFALQALGTQLQKNVMVLTTPAAVVQFLQGHSQPLQADVQSGYVHVRYQDFELGCGLYRDGYLHSQVPKVLRSLPLRPWATPPSL
ncbi:methyltransferase RsmF C-terminal domain-like protein [Trichothermofontia sp.]